MAVSLAQQSSPAICTGLCLQVNRTADENMIELIDDIVSCGYTGKLFLDESPIKVLKLCCILLVIKIKKYTSIHLLRFLLSCNYRYL